MLYRKKEEPKLSEALFQNPTSEYRGTPFWAWNCKVTEEQIDFQTEALKEMGMGGAHIHCRTGMNIPYMREEFLDRLAYAHWSLHMVTAGIPLDSFTTAAIMSCGGTDAWRTEGETWAYEYQLTETGLLTAPFVGLDYKNNLLRKVKR